MRGRDGFLSLGEVPTLESLVDHHSPVVEDAMAK